jgi:nucleoside-diphosphate-sugar epimerase
MNASSKILLVGGSGTLGKPTAQLLVKAGYPLRLMTRYPEKVGNFRSAEMEIFKRRSDRFRFLENCMRGYGSCHRNGTFIVGSWEV